MFSKRNKDTVFNALSQVKLFEGLNKKQLKEIEKIGYLRNFVNEEIVFYKGEPSYGIYVVLRGQVNVCIRNKNLQKYRPFDFFGELCMVKDNIRTATAISKGESVLFYIHEPALKDLFSSDPKIGFCIYENTLSILSEIVQQCDKRMLSSR